MPDALYRLIAFPNGIAMIGLGGSLWLVTRRAPPVVAPTDDIDLAAAG